ncbi:MAG TPA: ABC transporter permease [Candidatus Sulfomarinibacteraceae bacterium]|nr:ABC transporter permease [Candidatus Sulfomarinibacteraceae bacterium]
MKKAFLIGLKDLQVAARDRAALVLMLAAPFVLTLGLGLISGRFFGSSSSGLQDIPVVVVDQDGAQLGQALVETFQSEDLETLLEPMIATDAAAAREAVDRDEVAAAVIVPAGFTGSVIPDESGATGDVVQIEVYANPARPISSGVVEAVVQQFLGRVESATLAGQVAVTQLLQSGLIAPQEAVAVGRELGAQAVAGQAQNGSPVTLLSETVEGVAQDEEVDPLAILAPAMAIFFLMYTVSHGGYSLLKERQEWTLQRLLTTPTPMAAVLGGKVFGIFLTGLAQLLILIFGTSLLFRLQWGQPLAVLALIVATVLGATGWGLLLAALARTPYQVSSVGTALMLLFGILGGSFIPAAEFPRALQSLRLITPNAWALDALAELAQGAALADVSGAILALLLMALLLGAVSLFAFQKRQVFA